MKTSGSRLSYLSLAVLVALFAALALLGYLEGTGPIVAQVAEGRTDSAEAEQLRVRATIARTHLRDLARDALGEDYGGAWFDPLGRRVHIGVTSPGDRRTVEALAAQQGLADSVVATPVRSSWDELAAAQKKMSRRFGDLLESGELKTAIVPDRNAVVVELGSEVADGRLGAVDAMARATPVEIELVVGQIPRVGIKPRSRCNEWNPTEAYCDPTIVAGVSIDSDPPETQCTAGPAVIRKKPKKGKLTPINATETFVLTAGHCIKWAGGTAVWWYAYNKAEEHKAIGVAAQYKLGGIDAGVIRVDNPAITKKTGYWAVPEFSPVAPTVIPSWEEFEPEPLGVQAQWDPMKGEEACLSAQTTGTQCGSIIAENAEGTIEGQVIEELFEVEGVMTAEGDSGGPWWNQESASLPGGTEVGTLGSGNEGFQSLKSTFSKLETEFELLTVTNQVRHQFAFHSEGATLTGSLEGEEESSFGFDVGEVTCAEATYTGELAEGETGEIEITPSYAECKMFGIAAPVDVNGCKYLFTPAESEEEEESSYEGALDLECPEESALTITAFGCKITVFPQVDREGITYTNSGSESTRGIAVDLHLSELEYEEHSTGPIPTCAAKTVAKANGTHEGTIAISGEAGESHRGVWVE